MNLPTALAITLVATLLATAAPVARAAEKWTPEQANAWYAKQPWLVGSNFIPSNATQDHLTGLLAKRRAKTLLDVEQEYPDGTVDSFQAYVGNFKKKAPVDGILRADVSFRLTSDITTT